MKFLHWLGFCHLDITARNIMLADEGKCYLMDFDCVCKIGLVQLGPLPEESSEVILRRDPAGIADDLHLWRLLQTTFFDNLPADNAASNPPAVAVAAAASSSSTTMRSANTVASPTGAEARSLAAAAAGPAGAVSAAAKPRANVFSYSTRTASNPAISAGSSAGKIVVSPKAAPAVGGTDEKHSSSPGRLPDVTMGRMDCCFISALLCVVPC